MKGKYENSVICRLVKTKFIANIADKMAAKYLNTGGRQIVQIQTVRFHYSAVNFWYQNIRFYSKISDIAIFRLAH